MSNPISDDSALTNNLADRFKIFKTDIEALVKDVLSETNSSHCHRSTASLSCVEFDFKGFWQKLDGNVSILSKEATNITIAFCSDPIPDGMTAQKLLTKIYEACVATVSIYFTPCYFCLGRILEKSISDHLSNLLQSVLSLTDTISSATDFKILEKDLRYVGNVWEHCETFKNQPKSASEILYRQIKQHMELIGDAVNEIEQSVADDNENDSELPTDNMGNLNIHDDISSCDPFSIESTWTTEERAIVSPAIGLMKASYNILKRSNRCLKKVPSDTRICGSLLDKLSSQIPQISTKCDDFASVLYPPIQFNSLSSNLASFKEVCLQLLDLLEPSFVINMTCPCYKQDNKTCNSRCYHFTSDSDKQWLNFLRQALEHNAQTVLMYVEKIL